MRDISKIPIWPMGLEVLGEFAFHGLTVLAKQTHQSFRLYWRRSRGRTLRPGARTPLWNALRKELRPHLRRYGDQAILARQLGLPRQRVNAYVTRRTEMPDAERTLQLLLWLVLTRRGRRPK